MDLAFGFDQGASIWLVALGLGALAAAIVLLRIGARRRRAEESGQPHLIGGMALLVLGVALLVPGAIWVVTEFASAD